ncbi:MAG: hypothetical protein KC620_23075 [Myxococcales bacterium]|nr:hypothetical protein [Myxococcales bacterium]
MITRRHALALAALAPFAPAIPSAAHKVRGMTISCPMDGVEWGTDVMLPTLRQLAEWGINWVAIHPYAGIRTDGAVFEWRRLAFDRPPAWIVRPIREAHALGLRVLIKPHLGYWGSGFSWRGDITFADETAWRRFFADYTRWITKVADASSGADAFVVGTELDRTLHREADWRRVIGTLRARFGGPLTYAANWPEYARVPFWDALDIIGVQAYFPLIGPGEPPTEANLAAGWHKHLVPLHAFAARLDRSVVFTELGYNEWAHTAEQPWAYNKGGADAQGVQSRALASALAAIGVDRRVVGAFLWKCFPKGMWRPEDFDMTAPNMVEVIRRYWG